MSALKLLGALTLVLMILASSFLVIGGQETVSLTAERLISSDSSLLAAFSPQNSQQYTRTETRYMTSDQHSENGFTADILNLSQSNQQKDDQKTVQGGGDSGDLAVDWGTRFFILREDGSTEEITDSNQDPVAIVSRGPNEQAEGIQSATYQMPETNLNPGDALLSRVYIQIGGSGFQEISTSHTTESLNASKINQNQVEVFYYTERVAESGGNPSFRFTTGRFYWGDTAFNSRIEGFKYEKARVEANQFNPNNTVDTYPTQSFDHKVQLTCKAGSCENIELIPQACQGNSCTNFQDVSELGSFGLDWEINSTSLRTLSRDEAVNVSIPVDIQDEGEYRVRFNVTSGNVEGSISGDGLIDVHVSNPAITDFTHENLEQAGINEYETGDTIDYIDTEVTAFDGKAFNLTVAPRILNPDDAFVTWGPNTLTTGENLSQGQVITDRFSGYQIPEDESPGNYTFEVGLDWNNFGPKINTSNTFNLVNLRETFYSQIQEESIFQGEATQYTFRFTNKWSQGITDAEIVINCSENINCSSIDQNQFSTVSSGDEAVSNFEVNTSEDTETGEYDINATINYTNPNEVREWREVEPETLKVSSNNALLTQIIKKPDNQFQAEFSRSLDNNRTVETFGSINGTGPMEQSIDSEEHWIYGKTNIPSKNNLRFYRRNGDFGGLNETFIGDEDEISYCVFQTLPEVYNNCENKDDSFVGFWTLDRSDTSARDFIGGKDGQIQSNPVQGIEAPIGRGFKFDGASDHIIVSANESLEMSDSGEVTVSMWINKNSTNSDYTALLQKSNQSYNLHTNPNGKLEFSIYDGNYNSATGPVPQLNKWYHVAGVFDGSEIRIYVDGELRDTGSASNINDASGSDLGIAKNLDTGGGYFDGKMSGIRLYRRALSDQEIDAIANPNSSIGTEIEEPLSFPQEITRGGTENLEGSVENPGNNAEGVTLEWLLPSGWDVTEGNQSKDIGILNSGEKRYNNITTDISLLAERGEAEIGLRSENGTGDRGELSTESLFVYADTGLDFNLNDSNAAYGQTVKADLQLNIDTGGVIENQFITLRNQDTDEVIDVIQTNGDGKASVNFEVKEGWSVGENLIEAEYSQNDTEFTRRSTKVKPLQVSDFPTFDDVRQTPSKAGFGKIVTINTSVTSEDGIKDVFLDVKSPSGDTYSKKLNNPQNDSRYITDFKDTWENGDYSYNLTAVTNEGFENKSTGNQFKVSGKASKNIVLDQNVYGPFEDVYLDREQPVSRIIQNNFSIMTKELSRVSLFSDEFITLSGTSNSHTNTHAEDGLLFEMTEQGGSPPSTPDEFEGVYTYKTEVDNPSIINIESIGQVTGGSWTVSARNYDTGSFDEAFTITENTKTVYDRQICSGNACNDYVQNGEIEVQIFAQSDRGTDEFTYSVDFQEINVSTDDGPIKGEEDISDRTVGNTLETKNRYYSRFDFDELPLQDNANIESAKLEFDIVNGSGTGELYHVKRFNSSSDPDAIHNSQEPLESNLTNPFETFAAEDNRSYSINITEALNQSFEASEDLAIQLREEGETLPYELKSEPEIRVNYSTDSRLANTGNLDLNASLDMRVQRLVGGSWDTVGLPQVTPGDGRYPVNSSTELNISKVWANSGGFNTQVRPEGLYRVKSAYVDPNSNALVGDSGTIIDTYEFQIEGPELELSEILHSNQLNNNINEFETTDNLEFVDITIENNQSTAANARVNLNVLDQLGQKVEWGPDSEKSYGDIEAGENKTRRWEDSGSGYYIPEDASSGTFNLDWNATLNADNSEEKINSSFGFIIHDIPSTFESSIDAEQNRIFRNKSTTYNFSLKNPWSEPIQNVEVTIQCDSTNIGCEGLDSGLATESVSQIPASGREQFSFNLTTDNRTDIKDYDISTDVEYVNPSGETKLWENRSKEILRVRIPGSLINVTKYPKNVTRGVGGYEFNSYTNNTYEQDLTNVTTEWTIPNTWNNDSGSLEVFEDVQSPGELIYNNFTASIDGGADIGPSEVRIGARNDQGREDDFILDIDVFSDAALTLNFNNSQPAVNETVRIFGELTYDNGTALSSQRIKLRDETIDKSIGEAATDENGKYSLNYKVEDPEGNRIINASYSGSEEEFTNSQFNEKTIEITGTPTIERIEALPDTQGFGKNLTLETELEGTEIINQVIVDIEKPSGELVSKTKNEVQPNIYRTNFSSFEQGLHSFTVKAENDAGNTATESSTFLIDINQSSSIQTLNDSYIPGDEVNLTTRDGSWWDKDWRYRSKIKAEEISSNKLSEYPAEITLENLGEKTNSCDDIRVVQNIEPKDLYIEKCNQSGQTIINSAVNLGSSKIDNLFVYYGNNDVAPYNKEKLAYKIEDEGTVGSDTSLSVTDDYNGGDSVFRKIDITVFGGSLEASVEGLNRNTGEFDTLFSGNPANGDNIINRNYFESPNYTRLEVNLKDTSNNPGSVSYEYNYTTPSSINATEVRKDEKLPSIIENSGTTEFEGRINLLVEEKINGGWVNVSTRYLDNVNRNINVENLGNLWNQDPWIPSESGEYRAKFELLDPEGSVLTDGNDPVTSDYSFLVGEPPTDVNISNIEIYNVTSSTNPKDDFSHLESSGTNTSLTVPEGERLRFDAIVENSADAEADWEITGKDIISYDGFNSSWGIIDPNTDIFYENSTRRYEGGSYNGGVEWDTTSGGLVPPGETARFSFIISIPEGEEERDISLEIDDTTFTETDSSLLRVIQISDNPPTPLGFDLNSTLRRGEIGKASIKWDKDISEAEAEYDIVQQNVLSNFSVSPNQEYTNYSFGTGEDWFRGTHQFKMYGTDFSGNSNSTETQSFDVFGTAQIDRFNINPDEPEKDDELNLQCKVEDGFGNSIDGYNVDFFDGADLINSTSTNSTGWANSDYIVNKTGEYDIFCVIEDQNSDFYLTPGDDGFQSVEKQLFVANTDIPDLENFGSNVSRIFKTTEQDVGEFFTDINHSSELDSAALTFGEYDLGNYPYGREINYSGESNILGAINGSSFIDDGIDDNKHMIYGDLTAPEGSAVLRYEDRFGGGLNTSKIEDGKTGNQLCSLRTLPKNSTNCPDSGNLKSYWTLDGYEEKSWDLIGGNHGVNVGNIQQSADGAVGPAYGFNGTNQYVETDADASDLGIQGNEPKTIMAWANTDSFDDSGAIFSLGNPSVEGEDISLKVLGTQDNWRAKFGGSSDIDFSYPSRNVWVHFAIVHTGTETKIYTDGTEEASSVQSLNTNSTEPFRIGWWTGKTSSETFDGRIDDVRVYDSALNTTEITSIYNLGSSLEKRKFEASGKLPESSYGRKELLGQSDTASFEISPLETTQPQDTFWNIHVNDTSGNINSTGDIPVDIWAWGFLDEEVSGLENNPIENGSQTTMKCRTVEGGGNPISDYQIEFYDNETGSSELIGTNKTNSEGYASLSKTYNDIGNYKVDCLISNDTDQNVEVYNKSTTSEILSVKEEVSVPKIENNNYFKNDSKLFVDEDILAIYSKWDRTIDEAQLEYNYTGDGDKVLRDIQGPYTDNWVNDTLSPNSSSWEVGNYVARPQAVSTNGGRNDTLEFKKFDVFSRSEVESIAPVGQIEQQNNTDLVCRVYDSNNGKSIEGYNVEFFDENSNFIGSNETMSNGESVFTVDTSGDLGPQEYSCRIEDQPGLFYETGAQVSDTINFEFVDQLDARLVGDIENPVDGVSLAKDKFFELNASITCRDSDCGEVNATSRYNESGDQPDTEIPSFSGKPFYTRNENERVCGQLNRGETCNVSFNINATGQEEGYSLDVEMDSTNSQINQTESINIDINTILILNVEYDKVDFGLGNPNENLEGSRNADNIYTVSLDENSNDADGGLWGNLSNIEHLNREPTDEDGSNTIISPNRTLWDSQSTCAIEEGERFDEGYIQLKSRLDAGSSFTKCFFQEVPYGKYEGPYSGELTIKVNRTN